MAELLLRGWNVAIPEVDVGDDIFVVRDATRTSEFFLKKKKKKKKGAPVAP